MSDTEAPKRGRGRPKGSLNRKTLERMAREAEEAPEAAEEALAAEAEPEAAEAAPERPPVGAAGEVRSGAFVLAGSGK